MRQLAWSVRLPESVRYRIVGLALISTLVAALVPAVPAQAIDHAPWDQPGSTWRGTIEIQRDITTSWLDSAGRPVRVEEQGSARLTQLRSLGGTADDAYEAQVLGSGTYRRQEYCTETLGEWSADVHTSTLQFASAYAFYLDTDDAGITRFWPTWADDIPYSRTYCGGSDSGTMRPPNSQVLWLGPGAGSRPGPVLPDLDLDPLHLVGSKTWTLQDPPYALHEEITEYTYTVTYDLWLVTDCTIEAKPGANDSDGDRLPNSYESDIVGSDPANADTDGDCVSDTLEIASGSSPLDISETPDTLPSGRPPTNVVGSGDAGITCGRTKFKWVTPALRSLGVAEGKRACILLISNDTANAVIDFALSHDKETITSALIEFSRSSIGEQLEKEALDWAEEEAQERKLDGFKRGAKKALLRAFNLTRINAIYTWGRIAGLAGVAYAARWGIQQVRDHHACIQLRIGPSSTGEAKLSWSLVYSMENLTEEGLADGLHKASVWKKKVVNNGIDRAVRRSINLTCDQGKVTASGTGASQVFDNALSFVFAGGGSP